VNKNLEMPAMYWSKTFGPRPKANWNKGEICDGCRHAKWSV